MRNTLYTATLLLITGAAAVSAGGEAVSIPSAPAGEGSAGVDEATAVAVDGAGDVFVTGFSQSAGAGYDYVTLKYAPNGDPLWVRRYDGPGGEDDKATAIATDAAGSAYITGSSQGMGAAGRDIATVKYASDGKLLWVQRYNGPGSGYDAPIGLKLDSAGHVFVAGYSRGAGTGFDYVTLKYDADGKPLWTRRYNGEGNGDDRAAAMAVDAAGGVCVTGGSHTTAKNVDYLTVKYGADGKELWTRRYNGRGDGADRAVAVAVDSSGDVCVTGTSNDGHRDGFLTVKYSPDGKELWTQRYHGPSQQDDTAVGLGLDGAGDVYVTGASYGGPGTGYDYVTLKYSPDGKPLWTRRYDGPGGDRPVAIGVDRQGGVIVTGDSYGGPQTGHDFFTLKYDADGRLVWSDRYDGPGHDLDRPTALALDDAGNAYVTGYSWGGSASRFDFATIKYDAAGRRQWVRTYDGAAAPIAGSGIAANRADSRASIAHG